MNKWEYKMVDLSWLGIEEIEAKLDLFGSRGWELVSMYRREAVLKRPLIKDQNAGL